MMEYIAGIRTFYHILLKNLKSMVCIRYVYDIDTVCSIDIKNMNGLDYLSKLPDNSVDLVLTDPPYIISKDTGMDTFLQSVEENKEKGIEYVKTDEEWETYKKENKIQTDENKEKYKKFGSIYHDLYPFNNIFDFIIRFL